MSIAFFVDFDVVLESLQHLLVTVHEDVLPHSAQLTHGYAHKPQPTTKLQHNSIVNNINFQWDLQLKDTLGPAIFVELSSFRGQNKLIWGE